MKHTVCAILFTSLGIAVVITIANLTGEGNSPWPASVQAAEEEGEKPSGPPPLVIDKSAPLLLEDPPEVDSFDVPKGPLADNTACYCCHANYEKEPFVVCHAEANVACVKCHGQSYDHRNDEDNITPPDRMYPAEAIEKNCKDCHDKHDAKAVDVVARWQQRCSTKTDPSTIVCTDCHGQHRLKVRTVRWNKKNGKLIIHQKEESPAKTASDLTKTAPPKETKTGLDSATSTE